jgi:hypothetical protein
MGAELERIAVLKSGIHRGSYLFHDCFLVVMYVHQVVANVLLEYTETVIFSMIASSL